MKAKELMIGDWVLCDKNAQSEYEFDNVNYQPYQIRNGEDIDYAIERNMIGDADVYQPIPLTAEILEKNGFVHNDLPFVQAWEQYGLSIYGDGLINCGQNVTLKCQYVHQLQHILRDCEIDDEIKLKEG